jgi:uncharacterized protein YifN (PemK superfamily)
MGSKQISLAVRPLKSWLMSINYNPKVGEILECDFGNFVSPPLHPIYNGLISPEIRKRRMVVVMNGKLPNSCCLVVPISSNFNLSAVERGFHIYLKPAIFDGTGFDDGFRNRWALSECITHVSKKRLFRTFNNQALVEKRLERELVSEIHRSIIKTVNAQSLLP